MGVEVESKEEVEEVESCASIEVLIVSVSNSVMSDFEEEVSFLPKRRSIRRADPSRILFLLCSAFSSVLSFFRPDLELLCSLTALSLLLLESNDMLRIFIINENCL